ncbi:AAA family ATPase [Halorubrum ezzemoulense]|uniref:AAA family ATPase n=1 Tax=Halorubrum ezzemoulense TaxID=337243 RepID=UPI002331311A|nr:ATP-binding protein [Halorubrum ezzemoulense]
MDSDSTDMEDNSSVESDYEDSVTTQSAPFDSFDSFRGYTDEKQQLHKTVIEPAGYDRYVTTSVLLFGDHADCQTMTLAKGITGELGGEYTFFHVDSFHGDFMGEANNIQTTLDAARSREPSFVLLTCLDEHGFGEAEYELLRTQIESIQQNHERVIVVCTAQDQDIDLTTHDSLFEVVIEVPKPGEEFRRGTLNAELERAERAGVIESTQLDEEALSELDISDLTLQELRTVIKRTVQRQRRTSDEVKPTITPSHIQHSISIVQAEKLDEDTGMTLFSEGDTDQFEPEIPSVTFDDIGGLTGEKQRLREAVTKPVEYSDTFREAGYSVGQGILLHGPPGNGKTMLAKAVANDLSYHFFSVKGPELEQPLVGVSEDQLRELFQTAREHAPSVIFFDEFDSLAPSRKTDTPVWKDDLVNTLLSELDGLEPLADVIVMAATNRVDELDDAVLRSGRFDTFIEIPSPSLEEQVEIFAVHIDDLPTAEGVTTEWFGSLCLSDLSGADIMAICRKALEFAVRDFDAGSAQQLVVTRANVQAALERLRSEFQDTRWSRGYQ